MEIAWDMESSFSVYDGSIQESMQVEHQVLPLGPKLFTTFKATITRTSVTIVRPSIKVLLESSLPQPIYQC